MPVVRITDKIKLFYSPPPLKKSHLKLYHMHLTLANK